MILLPAIDLMDGAVVRLQQGKANQRTIYSHDPAAFAKRWEDEGGHYLHVVDLDAAFTGENKNLSAVAAIVEALTIPCELGGGMRSEAAIRRALDVGVARVVIGTRAAESIEFVKKMVELFGGGKIAVGIDARDGIVAVKGWTASTGIAATELALQVQQAGAKTIIYTDIATDGMLAGPNFHELERMLELLKVDLVASGGVSSSEDLLQLAAMPGLYGAITGKALYEGKVNLRAVRTHLDAQP